jgi:hypothetical protein
MKPLLQLVVRGEERALVLKGNNYRIKTDHKRRVFGRQYIMNSKMIACLCNVYLLLGLVMPAVASDDWAFQLGEEAKEIYTEKKFKFLAS